MPKSINHIAVSVTDIHQAMRWYRDTLGMTVLVNPVEISFPASNARDSKTSELVSTIFGPKFGRLSICHLSSANGIGIELFQFIEPKAERRAGVTNFEFWKTGFFHIAVTDPLIEELAERIETSGGKKRTEVMAIAQGSGKKICFCEDPDGNIIEIYSHNYEQFWSNI